jgi:hypothetical protein
MKKIFGYDTEKRWDYENGFYITSEPQRTAKLLAHYAIYKKYLPCQEILLNVVCLKAHH